MLISKICISSGEVFENAEVDIPNTEALIESVIKGKMITLTVEDNKKIYMNASMIVSVED